MIDDHADADSDCIAAVMARAAECGLISNERRRIAGHVSAVLIERAKAITGLRSDTKLIEFALARIVVEDDFLQTFRALKGAVDPDLNLNF